MFQQRTVNTFLVIIVSIFLAYAQLWEILINFKGEFKSHIDAAIGVLNGTPHWETYQNRILGPYFYLLVKNTWGLNEGNAYILTLYLQSFLMQLTIILTWKSISGSWLTSYAVAVISSFFVALFLQGKWLYLWDFFDFIFISLILWSWFKEKSLFIIFFILLFAIFNRELSIIVLFWLTLISGINLIYNSKNIELDRFKKIFFSSLIFLTLGYFIINFLREFLLIKELGPEIFGDAPKNINSFFHFKFLENLESFKISISNIGKYQIYNFIIIEIFIISLFGLFSKKAILMEISLLVLIMFFSTILFAVIYETRVWISFVPLMVFLLREQIKDF